MILSTSATRTSVVGAAARIAVLLFIFGLAECAAGSCLSYGHSCWGAHGKRSGNAASPPEEVPVPDDGTEGLATPEDTRWFFSKLVQADPATKNKLWQRFGSVHAMDRRHKEQPWKGNGLEEDGEGAPGILRENDAFPRSRGLRLEGSDESAPGIFIPASGEFPGEESQDADVLVMADDQPIRRVPKKLRVFKIMNPERKLDK